MKERNKKERKKYEEKAHKTKKKRGGEINKQKINMI
jgi:hypothetical protein